MSTPHTDPGRDLPSDPVKALALQVDRDNVLQARAVLLDEALRLKQAIQSRGLATIELCGNDPVSVDARDAFNERIGQLDAQCRRHTDDLEAAAQALGEIASRYGYTEDQIATSFSGR